MTPEIFRGMIRSETCVCRGVDRKGQRFLLQLVPWLYGIFNSVTYPAADFSTQILCVLSFRDSHLATVRCGSCTLVLD